MTAVTIPVVDVNDKPQAGRCEEGTKQIGWLTQCDFNSTFWTAAIVVPVAGNATGNATASADISFARSSFFVLPPFDKAELLSLSGQVTWSPPVFTQQVSAGSGGCIFCNCSHLRLRYLTVKSSQLLANQCSTIPWTKFQVSDLRGGKKQLLKAFCSCL